MQKGTESINHIKALYDTGPDLLSVCPCAISISVCKKQVQLFA